jgi:hypothetical protein
MLAEIFMLHLEMQLRIAATNAVRTSSDTRFVPVMLPCDTAFSGPLMASSEGLRPAGACTAARCEPFMLDL